MIPPMRIAVVNQSAGGGATVAARLTLHLANRGHDVAWFPGADEGDPIRLLAELAVFRPDIVHAHCWYNSYPYAAILELASRFTTALTVHDPFVVNQFGPECWECRRNPLCLGCPALPLRRRFYPNYRVRARLAKRRVNRRLSCHVVYPSRWIRDRLARTEWADLPGTVLPFGVDLPPDPARAPEPPGTPPRLLFVGNMYAASDDRKGLPVLLEAFRRQVLPAYPAATLTIAGRLEGDVAAAAGPGLRILGDVPAVRLPSVYAGADVLVTPSLADNLPLVVLEGMAAALPVVATRAGGIPEAVVHGRTGLLVPPGQAGPLGGAVLSLLRDRDLAVRMGRAGRRRVEEEFRVELHLDRLAALYGRLGGSPAG